MSNKKSGFQSLGRKEQSVQTEQSYSFEDIDFEKMTKKELKQFDEKYGSYRRLLNGKPITKWWLLNHYSKANAEAYKAQKKAGAVPPVKEEPDAYENDNLKRTYKPIKEMKAEYDEELTSADETIFIDPNKRKKVHMPKAYLDCLGFNQKVSIEEVPFMIGRDTKDVQLCIADNLAIGRHHAVIDYSGGKYYIEDLGSKNHTYLNDRVIPVKKTVMLENRMKITLGDEKFIFYCEE